MMFSIPWWRLDINRPGNYYTTHFDNEAQAMERYELAIRMNRQIADVKLSMYDGDEVKVVCYSPRH